MNVTGHKSEKSLKTYSGVKGKGTERECLMPSVRNRVQGCPSTSTTNADEDVDLGNIIGNINSSESIV